MTRPRFSFRPNLQNEEHCKASHALQTVPEGQRSAFLVRAILESAQKETLETTLRVVSRNFRKKVCRL